MQQIRSSNPPVITGICDPYKFRARQFKTWLEVEVAQIY